jgi:hypothetical protein
MFVVTHPPYPREKARRLRVERKLSLNEIAERLALDKTTVWCWIEDLPDPEIKYRMTPGRRRALAAAKRANTARFKGVGTRPTSAAETNSRYSTPWTRFWAIYLGVEPALFRLQRKSNSGRLKGRNWRSRRGVLTVNVDDTQLRARLQGWIDRVQEGWLDSLVSGV